MVRRALRSWREMVAPQCEPGGSDRQRGAREGHPARLVLAATARATELRSVLSGLGCDGRVLDIACGPGVTTRLVAGLGADEVIGVDSSPAMVDLARQGPEVTGVRFRTADARALPFDTDTFDAAVLGDFYHPEAVAEARRVVRPGGLLVTWMTDVVPGRIYGWDPGLDARVRTGYRGEEARRFPGAPGNGWIAGVLAAGFGAVSTITLSRTGALEALCAAYVLIAEYGWRLRVAYPALGEADRTRLTAVWDPNNPDAYPRRADHDLSIPITMAAAEVTG